MARAQVPPRTGAGDADDGPELSGLAIDLDVVVEVLLKASDVAVEDAREDKSVEDASARAHTSHPPFKRRRTRSGPRRAWCSRW